MLQKVLVGQSIITWKCVFSRGCRSVNCLLAPPQKDGAVCPCCCSPGFGSDLWPFAVCHAPLSRPVYCHSLDVLNKTTQENILLLKEVNVLEQKQMCSLSSHHLRQLWSTDQSFKIRGSSFTSALTFSMVKLPILP